MLWNGRQIKVDDLERIARGNDPQAVAKYIRAFPAEWSNAAPAIAKWIRRRGSIHKFSEQRRKRVGSENDLASALNNNHPERVADAILAIPKPADDYAWQLLRAKQLWLADWIEEFFKTRIRGRPIKDADTREMEHIFFKHKVGELQRSMPKSSAVTKAAHDARMKPAAVWKALAFKRK